MQRLENIKSPIHCLAWSPGGEELLATYNNGMKVGRWAMPSGKFRRWHPYIDYPARSVAFSPDGKWLAVGSNAGLVLPYLVETDNYDSEFHAGNPFSEMIPVYGLVWAPHREKEPVLAVASLGLSIWSCEDDGPEFCLAGDFVYTALAWSADERWLAGVNCDEGTLDVYRLDDRLARADQSFSTDCILRFASLAIAPNNPRDSITLAASGRGVSLFAVERDKGFTSHHQLPGHTGEVTQVAFHPQGTFLVSGGTDGSVRYWDIRARKELQGFDWDIGKVLALAFAPDGMRCAAGGSTGTVVVWDVDV